MPIHAKERDEFLETLDEPKQALEYGGLTGKATIKGVPTGRSGRPGEKSQRSMLDLHTEPVPVLLRDAVTIDTAVRLLGINRVTLQRAAARGDLPVLKLGPDKQPYLVRLRDVLTYLITMWTERRWRKESGTGDLYLGFPEWLAREIFESWPEHRAFLPGKWQAKPVKINRGGRPRGHSPSDPDRPGYSVHGVKLGRPPQKGWPPRAEREARDMPWKAREAEAQKTAPPEGDHPRAGPSVTHAPLPNGVTQSMPPLTVAQRQRLPKWHPLWVRPTE